MHQRARVLDKAVDTVAGRRAEWAGRPIAARLALLGQTIAASHRCAAGQVRAACEAKGIAFGNAVAGEEWMAGPMITIRYLRLLADTLTRLENGVPLPSPDAIRQRPNSQLVARVFPGSAMERLLYRGVSADVWMQPDVTRDALRSTVAPAYAPGAQGDSAVALVLGAGNVASIGAVDALWKLFVDNRVAVLKMNPVNDYLRPYLEEGLAPLIEAGYLRIVSGGAEEGAYLVEHPQVDEIHVTGGAATFDRIVWGSTLDEQARNKAAHRPRVSKRITSELGCVTPVIVVPGRWPARAIDFHAANIATMLCNNASFNCNAARLLVTARDWPQRAAFLARVEAILTEIPPRVAYYPTAAASYERVVSAHPEARPLGRRTDRVLPWTTIFGIDPDSQSLALTEEAWCGVVAETALPAGDAGEFLARAAEFCNERVAGTLSATVLIDPSTEQTLGRRFDRAIGDLRYGCIGINHWAALGFAFGVTTWGAFPGSPLEDIGSGQGVVHNARMFDRAERSVVRGPFLTRPDPVWFVTHRNAHRVAARMTALEAHPTWGQVPAIVASALRG